MNKKYPYSTIRLRMKPAKYVERKLRSHLTPVAATLHYSIFLYGNGYDLIKMWFPRFDEAETYAKAISAESVHIAVSEVADRRSSSGIDRLGLHDDTMNLTNAGV